MVYAYAAACHLGIQTFREASWERREQKYQPERDLFTAATAAPAARPVDLYAKPILTTTTTRTPKNAADDGWSFDRRG